MIFLLGNYSQGKTGETSILGGRKAYQLKNIEHIHVDITDSVLENDNLFFPEFGCEMEHIGYLNSPLSSYLVSLKYDFHELSSYTWLPLHSSHNHMRNIPYIRNTDRNTQVHWENMFRAVLWVVRKNATGKNALAKKLAKNFMPHLAACRFINKMYYTNE